MFVFTPEVFFVFVDCKTVVFFANAGERQYENARRSGASVKTARENGERRALQACRGSHASQARIALEALHAFPKRPKTTVLQSIVFAKLRSAKRKVEESGDTQHVIAAQVSSGERYVKAPVFLNLTLLAIVS